MKPKILVLDDESIILDLFRSLFTADEADLFLEQDGASALRTIAAERPNVAIVDITLPAMSGPDVLRDAKRIDPGLSVIIATGHCSTQNAI